MVLDNMQDHRTSLDKKFKFLHKRDCELIDFAKIAFLCGC